MTTSDNRTVMLLGQRSVAIEETPAPMPGPGEVVVAIDAATTCGTDLKVFRRGGHPRMLQVPCPFGHEMTGVVAAIGTEVEGWREGDAVVVANSASCGVCPECRDGRENLCQELRYLNGAFADTILVPERFVRRSLHRRPAGLAPEVASLTEPLACVLHGWDVVSAARAESILVLGAGPIGQMFARVITAAGRGVVVADVAADRLNVATLLGAASVVPLCGNGRDGERIRKTAGSGGGFDLVVEATGVPAAWRTALGSARPGGTVLLFGGCAPGTEVALDTHWLHYSEMTIAGAYHHRPATFSRALEMLSGTDHGLEALIQDRGGLESVEQLLLRMERREILKGAVLPRR
jgi:L-iditol 2-dehydrogenase